jgi:hypothetical protein
MNKRGMIQNFLAESPSLSGIAIIARTILPENRRTDGEFSFFTNS